MSTEVTLAGMALHEMGISTVTEIGGVAATGEIWRQRAEETPLGVTDFHVYEGVRLVPVECRESPSLHQRYFLAPGLDQGTDLLRRLAPLP